MAGFNIKFLAQQFGEKEISSAIAKLRLRLDNIRPVLDQIGQIYLENTKRRFDSQTDPQGKVWKWNTKTTQFYKSRGLPQIGSYQPRPPASRGTNFRGVWTGKLYSALKYRMAGNTVIIGVKGSEVPYATTFHFGAKRGSLGTKTIGSWTIESPWGDIPPRPFIGTNKKTNEAVLKVLRNYLDVTSNTPQWPVGFPRS
jgi:phage gpG-like protein